MRERGEKKAEREEKLGRNTCVLQITLKTSSYSTSLLGRVISRVRPNMHKNSVQEAALLDSMIKKSNSS